MEPDIQCYGQGESELQQQGDAWASWGLNKDFIKDLLDKILLFLLVLDCLHGGLGKKVCIKREKARWARHRASSATKRV